MVDYGTATSASHRFGGGVYWVPRGAAVAMSTNAFVSHAFVPGARAPTPGIWLLSGLRVRECVLCTYSYAGGRLAEWLAPLRVRAYVRCRCRFTKVKRFSC